MKKISDWRVGTRLGAAFTALMLFTAVVGAIGLYSMEVIEGQMKVVVDRIYPLTVKANTLHARLVLQMSHYQSLLLQVDRATLDAAGQTIDENKKSIALLLTELDKGLTDRKARAALARYAQVREAFIESGNRMRDWIAKGEREQAQQEYLKTMEPLLAKIKEALQDIVTREHDLMLESYALSKSDYDTAQRIVLLLIALATLVGAFVSWFMTRSVTGPLRAAVDVAQKVASGDLSANMVQAAKDELGQLLHALDDMNRSLRTTVARVRSGAETISSATAQIAVGNEDLSSRTEEQASSLQETAASMEQMTSTVKSNAEHANQANTMFASAKNLAQQSVDRIGEVSDTMRMISASSQRMGEIVSVIDSIAFQTNILALNASVEAARAGEQGRGFAVVASEVRNLAQRSAASAKEIKALIDDSVEKVKHGDTLVAQAESIVRKMGENTQPVISLVGEIAQASQEQSEGIAQINIAITQIDSTTQQNAALVEEASAAAASLRDQAAELVQTVQHFQLGQDALATSV